MRLLPRETAEVLGADICLAIVITWDGRERFILEVGDCNHMYVEWRRRHSHVRSWRTCGVGCGVEWSEGDEAALYTRCFGGFVVRFHSVLLWHVQDIHVCFQSAFLGHSNGSTTARNRSWKSPFRQGNTFIISSHLIVFFVQDNCVLTFAGTSWELAPLHGVSRIRDAFTGS